MVKFEGDCLKQDEVTYSHGPIINIYIVYQLYGSVTNSSATLENCLFGAVSLTKNDDIDKYKYSRYGIGFDSKGTFSHSSGGVGKNAMIFEADMSNSVYANNKTRSILVLGEGFTQGIDNTTFYAEKMYSINFSESSKKICLCLHYNGTDSYLFVNGREMFRFKAKDSEIVETPICLGNISKDFSKNNMSLTGLRVYVYDFNVDFRALAADKILDIHKYLMEKNSIKCLNSLKNDFLQQ